MKGKINFPPSNSKLWDKVNTELENIIPINFPDSLFKKLSTSEISQRFDDWLHQFFLQSFGEKKKSDVMKKRRCPRANKQLEFLRRRKKECKAAHKALTKAGLTGTAEEQAISKEWFSLLRQHNKLRTALNKKKHQKEKMAAELKFRHWK